MSSSSFEITKIAELKSQIAKLKEKHESKMKMMEISFEQINNSRNDMIKQLASTELIVAKLKGINTTVSSAFENSNKKLGDIIERKNDEVTKLKESINEMTDNLNFVSTKKEQLKSTLDEIKNSPYSLVQSEVKKALAKHEDKK